MRRHRRTVKPSMAQIRRWALIKDIGCLACRQDRNESEGCEIHHQNLGGMAGQKRLGHEFTVGLCPWHHRGEFPAGQTVASMTAEYGPSLKWNPKTFRSTYGSDEALLEMQNELIRAT